MGDDCNTHYVLPLGLSTLWRKRVRDAFENAWDSRVFLQLHVFDIFRVNSEPVTVWLSLAYCVWKMCAVMCVKCAYLCVSLYMYVVRQ